MRKERELAKETTGAAIEVNLVAKSACCLANAALQHNVPKPQYLAPTKKKSNKHIADKTVHRLLCTYQALFGRLKLLTAGNSHENTRGAVQIIISVKC